jgi:hypothetical protein
MWYLNTRRERGRLQQQQPPFVVCGAARERVVAAEARELAARLSAVLALACAVMKNGAERSEVGSRVIPVTHCLVGRSVKMDRELIISRWSP